jgi:hypothetical protein
MTKQTAQLSLEVAIIQYRYHEIKHSRQTGKWLARLPGDMWIDAIQADSLKALKQQIDTVMTEVAQMVARASDR